MHQKSHEKLVNFDTL